MRAVRPYGARKRLNAGWTREDRQMTKAKHAERALEVALCLRANGPLATLAALTADNLDEIDLDDVAMLQTARVIVDANKGRILDGDVARVLANLRKSKTGAGK
jgi:hypothetical protein